MPIASVTLYVKSLVDQLPMPGGLPLMAAYITPLDPNVESNIPTAYVWPSDFDESRDGDKGGSIPRNTGPGTAAGVKPFEHGIDIYLIYFMANDQEDADSLFPGIIDAVMCELRTSPDPVQVTDPYTGQVSTLIDVGEVMRGRIVVSATANQAFNRYDCLLTCPVLELIQA